MLVVLFIVFRSVFVSEKDMWLTLGQCGSLALSIIWPSPIRSLKKIQKQIKSTDKLDTSIF